MVPRLSPSRCGKVERGGRALLPSEGQAAWRHGARSPGLPRRPAHARSPSPERPRWGAGGWSRIPTPEGLFLDPPFPATATPRPRAPQLTRCAKVSPGASTSPAAPPNSAAPSPRELGARSRGAARTLCTGCGWRGGQGSPAGPTAGAGSAAGGDSGARAGVAIFPEENGFFQPSGASGKGRKRTEPRNRGRPRKRAGAEVISPQKCLALARFLGMWVLCFPSYSPAL